MSHFKNQFASQAQRSVIGILAERVGYDLAMEIMVRAHEGGYDLASMSTVTKAAGYLSHSEASEVIDELKANL